jgi:hypothetical protein
MGRYESNPPLRLRWLAAGVAVGVAVAVLAGVWASRLVSPVRDPKAPTNLLVDAGPAHLVLPRAWQRVAPSTRLPGLDSERLALLSPSPGSSTMAVVTFGPADEQSLIPRALRALVHEPRSQPRATSLAGRPAWVYRALDTPRQDLMMDVTVLPTTAGMLAVACASSTHSSDAASDCASSVKSVSMRGVAALKPSPPVALALELPAILEPLDHARVGGRAALSRARSPEAQALTLHRLASQHLAVADRLRVAFGTAAKALIAAFEESGRAYAALGTAASDGSSARFGAVRKEVRVAEAQLGGAIDRVRKAGTREIAANPSLSPAAPVTGPARPSVTQPLLVVLLLLGSGVAGFVSTGPLTDATRKLRRARTAVGRA